ncbi:HEAT repeats family protein [Theileria parva strain Muguga]|uniref:Deoxyhypusine hydroxylase n=1 Tax=Theileria parva TaxID=5875 RepID=Q4N7W5_THEPA|nr:HEAT repeats family protein [Theileria parva strain Muguga]EAN33943.1 HEAT repeats family protein [Theileria parva strain Muguga]|eukprot:XP_766226.1 hypothetical protein [Theileria parva strain Muguga]
MSLQSLIDEFTKLDEFSTPSKHLIKSILLSPEVPLSLQLRALYYCRDLPEEDCSQILISALDVHFDTFMRHEIAYVIGQSGCFSASKKLAELVENVTEDPMVRHEAIEALAALKSKDYIHLIKKYCEDENRAVRDTCNLALHTLTNAEESNTEGCTSFPISSSPYRAIDPVRTDSVDESDLNSLSKLLFDQSLPLYKRYEALYKIRGHSGDEAAKIIGEALVRDKVSEVFRHECAFVLGQMQSVAPVKSLIECLKNRDEEPMARHEAALALGSCASLCGQEQAKGSEDWEKLIVEVLEEFMQDEVKVVSDSCLVAMDYINESKHELTAH